MLCNNSDIRLVGGSDHYEGRVEICFNETWGTICDGSWSTNDANVACRQLGYAATGISKAKVKTQPSILSLLMVFCFHTQEQGPTLMPSLVLVLDPSTLMTSSVVEMRTD